MTNREVWETDHGVTLYEPTNARPYYRLTMSPLTSVTT